MGSDVRLALRSLTRTPVLTAVVVATLALGIGANTAIFSVVDGILLRPLPFPESEELVGVWADFTERGGPEREWLSYPNFADLREQATSLESLAVYQGWAPTLTDDGEAERLLGAQISAGMFAGVLGVNPLIGRPFRAEEAVPGAEGVVLLSHGLWRSRFGASLDVVGRSLSLDGEPHTVVGVMPEGFRPPFVRDADVWRPLRMNAGSSCGRGCINLRSVGRLAEGASLARARSELEGLSDRLREQFPAANAGTSFYPVSLREDLVGEARTPLWLLLGAVGFVLLIACVNVANLLLARGAARKGQVAVRAALGAGRGRIAREVLVESLVLAGLGGAVGVGLAYWGTDLLVAMAPDGIPRIHEVTVDPRVLAFTVVVTVAAGLLFGFLPALTASRTDLRESLAGEGRGGDDAAVGRRTREGLVTIQIALALVLLVGAGLLVRTLQSLDSADLGYEPAGVLTLSLNLPPGRYAEGPDRTAFYARLLDRLRSLPDVESTGAVSSLPLSGFDSDVDFLVEGQAPPPPDRPQTVWIRPVTPEYFRTMGIEVVEGRGIEEGDAPGSPRVVVVNESFAERHFPDRNPVGLRIGPGGSDDPDWYEIVGVVENVKHFGIREAEPPAAYFSHGQIPFTSMFVAARTGGDPEALVPSVRGAIADLDPGLAASRIEPMSSVVRDALARERFTAALLGLFAALALVLASVGIYGVVSYGVSRRRREIGIRIAVGAEPLRVAGVMLREGALMAAAGIGGGLLGALVVSRLLEGLLYGVAPTDPTTFVATAGLLAGVALAATWIPAWRASRVEPARILRVE